MCISESQQRHLITTVSQVYVPNITSNLILQAPAILNLWSGPAPHHDSIRSLLFCCFACCVKRSSSSSLLLYPSTASASTTHSTCTPSSALRPVDFAREASARRSWPTAEPAP
mmetsp:Transcript_31866/g.70804  ORF Transcript_31866/g.70804 Transcript_31866/m.70804 type:complete len:113 (-) Transcript_31866:173-511(-)